MTDAETIDELTAVACHLLEIVKRQQAALAQLKALNAENAEETLALRKRLDFCKKE